MRIITFNVNGLMSFEKYVKEMFKCTLNDYFLNFLKVDILCVQETRGSKEKLQIYKTMKNYRAYFSHSKIKNGHAGVGFFINKDLFCKKVRYSFDIIKDLCDEGRIIYGDFGTFTILNIYFPFYDENYNGSEEKYEKVKSFYKRIDEFIKNNDKAIICGDFNACHLLKDHYQFVREMQRIDKDQNNINNSHIKNQSNNNTDTNQMEETIPSTNFTCVEQYNTNIVNKYNDTVQTIEIKKRTKNETYQITFNDQITKIEKPYKSSTELPYYFKDVDILTNYFFEKYQRMWLKTFVNRKHYIDVFNHVNPGVIKYTCWNTRFDLRPSNLGTRIDYFFVSKDLLENLKQISINNDVYGSDHCPIILDMELEIMNGEHNILTKNNNIFSYLNKS